MSGALDFPAAGRMIPVDRIASIEAHASGAVVHWSAASGAVCSQVVPLTRSLVVAAYHEASTTRGVVIVGGDPVAESRAEIEPTSPVWLRRMLPRWGLND